MKNKNYVQFLTNVDRLQVEFVEDRGKILRFSVHYCALIGKKWRPILRIDNFHHQNKPHRHSYYLKKKRMFSYWGGDANEAFTEAKKYIVKNYAKIKENYFLTA